jgi:hypothetical protein
LLLCKLEATLFLDVRPVISIDGNQKIFANERDTNTSQTFYQTCAVGTSHSRVILLIKFYENIDPKMGHIYQINIVPRFPTWKSFFVRANVVTCFNFKQFIVSLPEQSKHFPNSDLLKFIQ